MFQILNHDIRYAVSANEHLLLGLLQLKSKHLLALLLITTHPAHVLFPPLGLLLQILNMLFKGIPHEL